MTTLTYIASSHGDWCAIYVDSKLFTEGHHIPVHDWLDLMQNHDVQWAKSLEVCGDWLEDEGGLFPKNLSDVELGEHK